MPSLAIHIPQPCTESWEAMTATGAGRHCAACQKTVVDFTWKTDAEILAYLASASGETCGRLRASQHNRMLMAAAVASPAPRWRAWLAATLALWSMREGGSQEAEAHTRLASNAHHVPIKTRKQQRLTGAANLLRGVVRDAATHEPIVGVAVFLKGENRSATTDSSGHFSLRIPAGQLVAGRQLVLHRAGYLSRRLPLGPATSTMRVALHADPAAAGVQVTAEFFKRKEVTISGAITCVIASDDKAQAPPATQPTIRPRHGFFYWLTRPFRRG